MSRRSRRSKNNLATSLALTMLITVAALCSSLSKTELKRLLIISAWAVGACSTAILLAQTKTAQHERRKLRALDLIDVDTMDGLVFEKYVVEIMKFQGFARVQLTERYDLGIDIIATKDGVRWGVQVKRYSNMVKAAAVRQVVTALNNYKCQRAMVVTNSTFSRPAKILAQSNDCVLIGRDELADWILTSQNG